MTLLFISKICSCSFQPPSILISFMLAFFSQCLALFLMKVIPSHISLNILNIVKPFLRLFHKSSFNSNKFIFFCLVGSYLSLDFGWVAHFETRLAFLPSLFLFFPPLPVCFLLPVWWFCDCPHSALGSVNPSSDPDLLTDLQRSSPQWLKTDPGTKPGDGLFPVLVTGSYPCPLSPLRPQFAESCSPRQEQLLFQPPFKIRRSLHLLLASSSEPGFSLPSRHGMLLIYPGGAKL